METLGYSGRSAVHYSADPLKVIAGITTNDPIPEPEKGWNKRKWMLTPFGPRVYSGVWVPLAFINAEEGEIP